VIKIQFLTSKDISPNTHAIIYPLLRWKKLISEISYGVKIVNRNNIRKSDVIIVDSKFHKFWWGNKKLGKKAIIKDLKNLKKKCSKIVYYDSTDSSGCIQKEVIPHVDQYWKGQTLRNKDQYKINYIDQRIFTDFIYKQVNNRLEKKDNFIEFSSDEINKIKTAWNSSLTNYNYFSGKLARLATKYKLDYLLRREIKIKKYEHKRNNLISCRIFSNYPNKLISWQRESSKKILKNICDTNLVSKNNYHRELKNSKMTFSPFGWGEICYRDFESFFSGSLLIKPSMEHLETWPNLYINGKTYISCKWDLQDLLEKIENNQNNFQNEIIDNAREIYNQYLNKLSGGILFRERLEQLINNLI
tara:strand:+ start:3653 stop:4729 length:1077 start_codon:yes stop_codon:yes gene_type:complete